jgi:hypothetical protein
VIETFGIEGGAIVFSSATFGIIVSWIIAQAAWGADGQSHQRGRNLSIWMPSSIIWAVLALGITLNSLYFVQAGGFSQLASLDYLDRFQVRLTPGMGVLVYGMTLVSISLYLFLSRTIVDLKGVAVAVLFFLINFAATGERKYIIGPALVCLAAYTYRRRALPITAMLGLGALAYFVFEYVGFVRVMTDGGANPNAPTSLEDFLHYLAGHIGTTELAPIYGTASAAYLGFVDPLPGFGDYASAWQMAVPNFWRTPGYLSINDRFAWAFDATSWVTRMGWGFSFFGEAYVVLGLIGPALAAIFFCLLAMAIYRIAWRQSFQGPAGALWLSFIYYQIWVQRNAFAFFFKDWLIFEVIPIVLIFVAANLPYRRRQNRLSLAREGF